jgi:hypothetical protein
MRYKVGQEVYVKFYDHCQDGEEAIVCEVWGRIDRVSRVSIRIINWDLDTDCADTRASNQSNFVIVKSAIINARVLV